MPSIRQNFIKRNDLSLPHNFQVWITPLCIERLLQAVDLRSDSILKVVSGHFSLSPLISLCEVCMFTVPQTETERGGFNSRQFVIGNDMYAAGTEKTLRKPSEDSSCYRAKPERGGGSGCFHRVSCLIPRGCKPQ